MSYIERHNGFETSLVVFCEVADNKFDYWVSSACTHHSDPEVTVRWKEDSPVSVELISSSQDPSEVALGMAITALHKKGYNGYGVASKISQQDFLRRVAAKKLRNVTIEIDGEVIVWGSQTKF